MEKIQERALKFIYNENHSTYEELLIERCFFPEMVWQLIPSF
jgi:hypothetical protein